MRRIAIILSLLLTVSIGYGQGSTGGTRTTTTTQTLLQPETQTYLSRVVTAGSTVDQATVAALDNFVIRGKKVGWWSSVVFWAPMTGSNLNGALVKFVVDASGVTSLQNDGATAVAESDYSPSVGFALNGNTAKYLGTRFIPGNNGLSGNNISVGIYVPRNQTETGAGFLIADQGTNSLYINLSQALINGRTTGQQSTGGRRSLLLNITPTYYNGYFNNRTVAGQTIATSTTSLSTEVTIFRSNQSGSLAYVTNSSISGLIFTTGLSAANALDLNQAITELYIAIGRFPIIGGKAEGAGDSITAGQGVNPLTAWFYQVCAGLGVSPVDMGANGTTMATANTAGPSLLQTYTDFVNQTANYNFLMEGTNDMTGDAGTNGTAANITAYQNAAVTYLSGQKNRQLKSVVVGFPWKNFTDTKLDAYNNAMYAAATAQGVLFIDILNLFRDTGNPSALLADGTHPNSTGTAIIAKAVISAVKYGILYRDALIPATSVPAAVGATPGTATFTVSMKQIKSSSVLQVGQPVTTTAGITYTAAYTSDDVVTVTMSNSTASAVTTNATNLRLQFSINANSFI